MAKKLLLIEDVDNLGRSGDLVTAKPGYARNYLIPQRFAVVADARAIRMQTRLQEERTKKAIVDLADAEKVAAKITDMSFSISVKVDQDGHMYGSVSISDILNKITETTGITLEKKNILLKHPIKEVGVNNIDLRLKEGVMSKIVVEVVAESAV